MMGGRFLEGSRKRENEGPGLWGLKTQGPEEEVVSQPPGPEVLGR